MTKADKILIIFVLIASFTSMFLVKNLALNYTNEYVVIKVNNEGYKKYSLDDSLNEEIVIQTEYGRNVVVIKDGFVYVSEADCPDKLDVKQGKISKPGDIIVCLPNKLVIEITGDNEIGLDT